MDSDPYVIKLLSAGSEEDSSSVSGNNGGTTKNPKLEHMRSKIKDSLFKRKFTSKSEAVSLNHLEENSFSPIKHPSPFKRRGTASPNNPKLEKFRNLVKGSLSFVNSIASGSENQYTESPNVSELGLTPTSRNSFMDDIGQREGDSTSRSRSEKLGEEEFKEAFANGIEEKVSEEELEEYASTGKIKHAIFYNNLENEIESLKEDLQVEEDPNIHFIKGNFKDYYEEGDILGEGTTATVKKCYKKGTEDKYAVKIIHYRDDTEMLVLIVHEFKNSRRLDHHHIIKIYELYIDYWTKKIYTVMELAECKEMFEVLQHLGHYSEAVASEIFKQILTGINYLHTNGVCHRDLKPNNILVSDDGKIVKITDFNVSKFTENKQKKYSSLSTENCKMWTHTGTIAYTAPEVFTDNEYTEAVDMWSAGVVLYTMLCGYQPFYSEYVQELIALITEGKVEFNPEPWDHISDLAKDLVKRCLDINPKTRYLPSDALMHPWIANHGKVPIKIISFSQDNLKFYHSNQKGARSRPRRCTTKGEIESTSFSRMRPKRSGTALDASEIELYNNKEAPADYIDCIEKKNIALTKITKEIPDLRGRGVGIGNKTRPSIKTILNQPCDQIINENEGEENESPMIKNHFLLLLKSVSSPGEKISEFYSTEADEKDNQEIKMEKQFLKLNDNVIKIRKLSASQENSELDSEEGNVIEEIESV